MYRIYKFQLRPVHIISFTLAIGLSLLAYMFRVSYSELNLEHASGLVEQVSLPVNRPSVGGPTTYIIRGRVTLGAFAPTTFRVIPDDKVLEIKINDSLVPLDEFSEGELGNWSTGFSLDLSPFIRPGENTFQIRYSDLGAPGLTGMRLINPASHWYWLLPIALFVLLAPMWISFAKRAGISRAGILLYSLVGVGCIIRIMTVYIYNPVNHIGSDAQRHWEAGIDVLRVDLMTMTDPIMYQLYISILAKVTLKLPELVAFFTSILSVTTPWIWYRFFRQLQPSKTWALTGWAVLSLLPSWISIYSYFMQETLLLPLLGAALWATWRARRKRSVGAFCLMVALWIAAGLTRGIAIPFAAVCCTWLWVSQSEKMKKAFLSTALLALTLGPLTYRSYYTVSQFAPHGMGHLAAIYAMSGKREILLNTKKGGASWSHIFGSPSTGAEPFAPINDWKTQRTGRIVVSVDFDRGKEDWDKAYETAAPDFERLLWITKENLIFLFFATSWPDNNMVRVIDRASAEMRWIWAPATLSMIVWIVYYRRRLKGEWMLPALIGSWILVQGFLPISVNEGRYRKPYEGLLLAQVLLMATRPKECRSLKRENL